MKAFVKNGDEKRTLEMYERFLAGASAGIVAQTAIYPMEVRQIRFQTDYYLLFLCLRLYVIYIFFGVCCYVA